MNSRVNQPVALFTRALLAGILRPLARLLCGFRVEGRERLPGARRPLILVSNHVAFVDSIYFMLAVRPRFTICGAKPRFFSSGMRRALMSLANILRVDDREQFLADGGRLLDGGEILLVYPAMGRTSDPIGEFQPWAAELALATSTSLLPCYIAGTGGQKGDGPVRIHVGSERRPRGNAEELTAVLRADVETLAGIAA